MGPAWEPSAYAEVNRRPRLIAAAVAAVVVAGGIGAAIALGGSDGPARPAPSATAPTAPPGAMPLAKRADPEKVGIAFFADMQAHSLPGLRSLVCSEQQVTLTQAVLDTIRSTLELDVQRAPSTAQVTGHVFFQDDNLETITLLLRREGATSWCVYSSELA
ncbi:MAG TPA: hypothetical protein VGN18_19375 [Jatrophihabitans sp.]|jgi:hypothetical protein|uniref:hypothetical protein n=1 Tax=Jatrophihabitans sp. TaxID=1932789 RepID=UPI002DF7B5C0|nr:hypothetical protein [Jatrophihabitans sp.]